MATFHYYHNGTLAFFECPLSWGGSLSIPPGKYVYGDPTLEFGRQSSLGNLVDDGTGVPAAVTANSALLIFDENGFTPAGFGTSGFSGKSGYSGFSGTNTSTSGYSGFSGIGISGYSGFSGSGVSGYSGWSGVSGFSGWSGISGYSGWSGVSGWSGAQVAPYVASVDGHSGVVAVSGAGCTIASSGQVLWITVP